MIVKMSKVQFTTCDDYFLGWNCIKLVVLDVRGKDADYKKKVYSQLNDGQKALFSFYVYLNHARNSLEEFIWWSNHFYSQRDIWHELNKGVTYLNLSHFKFFIEKFEEAVKERDEDRAPIQDIDFFCTLFFIFVDQITPTLEQISIYIKTHPEEFIQFTD